MAVNEAPSASASHFEWDLTWVWVSLNTPLHHHMCLKDPKRKQLIQECEKEWWHSVVCQWDEKLIRHHLFQGFCGILWFRASSPWQNGTVRMTYHTCGYRRAPWCGCCFWNRPLGLPGTWFTQKKILFVSQGPEKVLVPHDLSTLEWELLSQDYIFLLYFVPLWHHLSKLVPLHCFFHFLLPPLPN